METIFKGLLGWALPAPQDISLNDDRSDYEIISKTNPPAFAATPGSSGNTELMYRYAHSLYYDKNATSSEREDAVNIFKEAANRHHIGATGQLASIYWDRTSKKWFYQEHNAKMAKAYANKLPFPYTVDDALCIINNVLRDVEYPGSSIEWVSIFECKEYGTFLYVLLDSSIKLLEKEGKLPEDLRYCTGWKTYHCSSYKTSVPTITIYSSIG